MSAAPDSTSRSVDEFRRSGHRLVDRMADYLESVGERPVSTRRSGAELDRIFTDALPEDGADAEDVWADVHERIVADSIHLAHPMYMGHQVAPPLPHAVLADAFASLLNQSIAVREMSPAASSVERRVVRWLGDLAGYPPESDGTFVSGGSAANLTGLLAARAALDDRIWTEGMASASPVIVTSEHAHYSIERAAGVMGMGSVSVRAVSSRGATMDVEALAILLERLRRERRPVLAVVATAASTATGRFDDLAAVAGLCERYGVWMHVDGAHGASYLLSGRTRGRLRGIERADSIAWDPHKMLFMPISAGVVLVRDASRLDRAFRQTAPYLFHPEPGEPRPDDAGARTLQCSRRFDALKLWVALKVHGRAHFEALLDHTADNAAALHSMVESAEDFEAAYAPETNILCFRHLPPAARGLDDSRVDAFQKELRRAYNRSGQGWITTTVLDGRQVLRVTLINPRTDSGHLEALLNGLRSAADALLAPAGSSAEGARS